MSKRAVEKRIEELSALRGAPDESAERELGRALKERNNYVVSKAAALVRELEIRSLIPELAAAFDRFMMDPVKTDPQCWAKSAIVKALSGLGQADAAIFLRGISHFQLEPVWGGREDTAATLRGACAQALIGTTLASFEILVRLTDLLNDPEAPVRIDAARAIGQLSAREGVLPLRLKALSGDSEPEVVGHCFAALVGLAPRESIPFVAGFLEKGDAALQMEAAGALAEAPEAEAFKCLRKFWERQTDPEVKCTILKLVGGSPLPETAEFLLAVLEGASGKTAVAALEALAGSRFRGHIQAQTAILIGGKRDPALKAAFEKAFASG